MWRQVRAIASLLLRVSAGALAAVSLYAIWIPGDSVIYDYFSAHQDEPAATASHVQSRGYFEYFRDVTTYYRVTSGVEPQHESGVSGVGLLKSLLATAIALIVLIGSTVPTLASRSVRHLTMRLSGP